LVRERVRQVEPPERSRLGPERVLAGSNRARDRQLLLRFVQSSIAGRPAGDPGVVSGDAEALRGLQRLVGNAVVQRLVQRVPVPGTAVGPLEGEPDEKAVGTDRLTQAPPRTEHPGTDRLTIRRMVIPQVVSGLDFDMDTAAVDFAEAIRLVSDPDVLVKIIKMIEADQPESEESKKAVGTISDYLEVFQQPEKGRVNPNDPEYAGYHIKDSLDQAEKLIDTAVGKLGSISADPSVMKTFRQYFTAAEPSVIVDNLRHAKDQIKHYRPHAPPAIQPGGGHACFDNEASAAYAVQYKNDGLGPEARLYVGVKALTITKGARAYNIVHEATHGAPGVDTVDHAYGWQRLFPYLTPDQQENNADSYALLVGVLANLTQATPEMSSDEARMKDLDAPAVDVETVELDPATAKAVKQSWAWFEHYTNRLFVDFQGLLKAVESSQPLAAGSGQEKLCRAFIRVFGLTEAELLGAVVYVKDEFDKLLYYATKAQPVFHGKDPTSAPTPPRVALVPPTSDLKQLILWHISEARKMPNCEGKVLSEGVVERFKRLYAEGVTAVSLGGPLS
jgi:hypothetical protein